MEQPPKPSLWDILQAILFLPLGIIAFVCILLIIYGIFKVLVFGQI